MIVGGNPTYALSNGVWTLAEEVNSNSSTSRNSSSRRSGVVVGGGVGVVVVVVVVVVVMSFAPPRVLINFRAIAQSLSGSLLLSLSH